MIIYVYIYIYIIAHRNISRHIKALRNKTMLELNSIYNDPRI